MIPMELENDRAEYYHCLIDMYIGLRIKVNGEWIFQIAFAT